MKASQLITQLQEMIDKYGDLPVRYSNYGHDETEPSEVKCYDANGWKPFENKEGNNIPWEFMLH